MERPNDDWDPHRQSKVIRILYGRNNPYAPDSGPFVTDAWFIALGLLLFVLAVLLPKVGGPLLLAYLTFVTVRFAIRRRRPYSRT